MKTPSRVKDLLQHDIDGGMTLRALCRKVDLHPNTVGSYLEGRAECKTDSLEKLAKAYSKTVAWLRGDTDEFIAVSGRFDVPPISVRPDVTAPVMTSSRTVPVISDVLAGPDGGYFDDAYPVGEGMERIECPADIIDPHAFAFRVTGDSMYPRYIQGEYVIVDTTKPVVNGDDVVVKLRDDGVLIKRYTTTGGMVILRSYNQQVEDIPVLDGDLVHCFKIVCRK